MLIKEYRIPLPLTVDEYRIAQLYMIAKKSREESHGEGSGVEIIINEPYENGPGGSGQYTKKIYHVGSHLPGWFKSLLPKSALTAEEEAWNAYPYTKTRYTTPFVEKFSIEIETYYFGDDGNQENVFNLNSSEKRNRTVDLIDVVKDQQMYQGEISREEDPKFFISEKTHRGPLSENWLKEYWKDVKGKTQPTASGKSLMCAYKLCKVEFRYWGMQSKIEKFIHDVALRKTMFKAHTQAWVWQDEWHGLTMDDIRQIERQTQEALKKKMGKGDDADEEDDEEDSGGLNEDVSKAQSSKAASPTMMSSIENPTPLAIQSESDSKDDDATTAEDNSFSEATTTSKSKKTWSRSSSKMALSSPGAVSGKSFEAQMPCWRMESIVRDSDSGSEEEFFDCKVDEAEAARIRGTSYKEQDSIFSHSYLQRVVSERGQNSARLEKSMSASMSSSPAHQPCNVTVLILVLHAGSVLDASYDVAAKKSDVTTFAGAFECVTRQHYPSMIGHIAIRLVPCPSICSEGLGILTSLSPYSFDVSPSCTDAPQITHDSIPIGAIPLFASSTPDYRETISKVIATANSTYHEFTRSEEGRGFNGQICFVGDSIGSILGYDALCRSAQFHSRHDSCNSVNDEEKAPPQSDWADSDAHTQRHLSAPPPRRRSSSNSDQNKLDFDVGDFFMFGTPLSLVLAYRKIVMAEDKTAPIPKPQSHQVYNLFHPSDPAAARLEPLISARFSMLPPVNIARYQKYPLGNGHPYHLLEFIQANSQMFAETSGNNLSATGHMRRLSEASIQSGISGHGDTLPLHTISNLTSKWWGSKRMDYAIYCPDGLSNFPTNALPHIFHSSYWESSDVVAFIIRQVGQMDPTLTLGNDDKELAHFNPGQPREKWLKKRTSVKLKNVAANHRANDVIVTEGASQMLTARFMYGPLDMITLAGERVDIHIMLDIATGEWTLFSTEVTDKHGRISYTIPAEKALGYGMYPVKMVVRGDHTSVDFYLAVVPPKTECVVFSIDGSFTASMSVTGRDPKVRAGAVDIVRHWQELGYLIIYMTGRPDMQQQKVVSWLSQHNFPHGLVSFADGLSTDPLGHKAAYLKSLMEEHGLIVHAAYGSSKDITVYSSIGLKPKEIFIVGKVSKKQAPLAQPLTEGYAAHLSALLAHGGSRPAQGNARMVIPRGYFGLPGQNVSLRRRSRSTRKNMIGQKAVSTDGGSIRRLRRVPTRPPTLSEMV
ncbi:protein retinal degeneration B isoform X2 [Neocloeon triangulifer]|uniref:protein retinal degeneration B isoform X2 n=1 Tax=Neocloeon triangulifer TaxID=2078957 RepID=UPI00286F27EF|nr:protein retinal degeneration B isoform X2 [Neocloeon triangulifer]